MASLVDCTIEKAGSPVEIDVAEIVLDDDALESVTTVIGNEDDQTVVEEEEKDEGGKKQEEGEEGVNLQRLELWPRPPSHILLLAAEILGVTTKCRVCRKEGEPSDLLACEGCGKKFVCHRSCWDDWDEHMPGQSPSMYEACVKTELSDVIWVNWLLFSKVPSTQQEEYHADDIWATWFAVPHYQSNIPPRLYLYPRMQNLVNMEPSAPERQFPSLVSFFGETGAGKSTLIRALIRNIAPHTTDHPVPVPGNEADRIKSTSGDVHLYADPETLTSDVPLFYADSEGLKGSGLSVAARLVSDAIKPTTQRQQTPLQKGTMRDQSTVKDRRRKLVKSHRASKSRRFDLRWAHLRQPRYQGGIGVSTAEPEPPHVDSESRTLVVSELYPRLLYAFSDVVCFITTNPRATERDIITLFEWARRGHERTINQRIRPGLIIIINKDTPNVDSQWLDANWATHTLLKNFALSTAFSEQREKWAARGKELKTAEDLILCYYDSFRVVCIPTLTGTKTARLIAEQYKTLYREIRFASARLRAKKKRVDMNLDLISFNTYLDHAFSKLAKDYRGSLNFYDLAEQDSPVPTKFSEHVTATLAKLQKAGENEKTDTLGQESALIKRFTPYLASCISMQIPSNADRRRKDELIDNFLEQFARGIEKFRDRHWRCEAKDPTGKHRCRNYWEGHEKGHQFYSSLGHLRHASPRASAENDSVQDLKIGAFKSSYDQNAIVDDLWKDLEQVMGSSHVATSIAPIAKAAGISEVSGNRTCLTCFSNVPTNILPCQPLPHTICEDCLYKFDHKKGHDSTVILVQCPLGCRFTSPWRIRLKPKEAGARILTLDGGGVRGILEICMLGEIAKTVGHGIPIQELFDLVIGTSTGGIIALGVFKMDWSPEKARQMFRSLSSEAFSHRQLLRTPVFRNVAQLFCSFRYKSEGIETALQKAFHRGPLFGHSSSATADRVKVAVVATTLGGRRPYVFANYSRNLRGPGDQLQREDDAAHDILTWQAARCTSAAPIYFEPYVHPGTRREYVDGAVIRNNPVRVADEEWRLIWQDGTKRPDIVLSLGTGVQRGGSGKVKSAPSAKSRVLQSMIPKGIKKKVATGFDMVQATLDCNKEWQDYTRSKSRDPTFVERCHRLDIGLSNKPPKIDEVDAIPGLENDAADYLRDAASRYLDPRYKSVHHHINVIARRLVAALFYFVEFPSTGPDVHSGVHRGLIQCRLSPNMDVQFASLVASRPIFRLRETCFGNDITQDIRHVQKMNPWDHQTFSTEVEFYPTSRSEARVIEVQFPRKSEAWEVISGF